MKNTAEKVDRRKPPRPNAGKSVKNSHTSPQKIEMAKKKAEALDLRMRGYSYPRIAEAMGISTTRAFELVDEALHEINRESSEKVLQLELERLDDIQAGIYDDAANGDPVAVGSLMKVMDRRANYLGLDAPKKSEVSGLAGAPIKIEIEDVRASIKSRLMALVEAALEEQRS